VSPAYCNEPDTDWQPDRDY
jgi:hypothetical protein